VTVHNHSTTAGFAWRSIDKGRQLGSLMCTDTPFFVVVIFLQDNALVSFWIAESVND